MQPRRRRDEERDVLVVGGGPAGSAAAAWLAMDGHDVLVCERERFPRFHVGESLLPASAPLLMSLGVWDECLARGFQHKHGGDFLFEDAGAWLHVVFRDALPPDQQMALHVRRAEFDALLLDNAAAKGAEVRQGCSVDEVLFDGGRAVGARLREGDRVWDVRARVVLDASGRETLLGRQLRLRRRDPTLRQAALFAHFRGARMGLGPEGGNILVVSGPLGWFWLIPLDAEHASVGIVLPEETMRQRGGDTLEAFFERLLAASPEVSGRLAGAERTTEVHPVANFSYRLDRFAGDGYAVLGDAAAFLDPVFSSGVHIALTSAHLAAGAVSAALRRGGEVRRADLATYERRFRLGLGRFRRYILGYYDPGFASLFSVDRPPEFFSRPITRILGGEAFRWSVQTWVSDRLMFALAAWKRRAMARGRQPAFPVAAGIAAARAAAVAEGESPSLSGGGAPRGRGRARARRP